jgi:CRP-like cAMP-binding protein
MNSTDSAAIYRIWGSDFVVYGPVELPVLIQWIKDERVTADSWLFVEPGSWVRAAEVTELKLFFQNRAANSDSAASARSDLSAYGIKPGSLRRIKILADMEYVQLESLLQYMEVLPFNQFAHVVRKGEYGDAIYFVLEGELRALSIIDGKETTLAVIAPGDFFGEISVLDQGPRSADVVANIDSLLLKMSSAKTEHLLREAPALAAPFLYNLSRTVVGRVRKLTQKYEDSIHFSRVARSAA